MSVRSSQIFVSSRRPTWISWSGREALPDVRQWSGDTPEYPGVVGRLSWISNSGWETMPDVREWSKGHPGFP